MTKQLTQAQTDYREKFKDPRWQKKRLQIMERDGFFCRNCGDAENTLNVHHRYYEHGKEPWDYPDEALVTLCEVCHDFETKGMKIAEKRLLKAIKTKFFASEIYDIGGAFEELELQHVSEVASSAICNGLRSSALQSLLIKDLFSTNETISDARCGKRPKRLYDEIP